MTPNEIIILNFEEIRRRSIKLWSGITPDSYFWRPDSKAMHYLEMIRHILKGEHLFHMIVNKKDNLGDYISPWTYRSYIDIQSEIEFAAP